MTRSRSALPKVITIDVVGRIFRRDREDAIDFPVLSNG
jgi:hypothetical protein